VVVASLVGSLLGILLDCWLFNFGAIWFIDNKICD